MLSDVEEATENFSKKIGSGGFGTVYYGKMKDEKEIAVKVLRNDSYQENRQFSNEVTSLHMQSFSLMNLCNTLSLAPVIVLLLFWHTVCFLVLAWH